VYEGDKRSTTTLQTVAVGTFNGVAAYLVCHLPQSTHAREPWPVSEAGS
jgi:hypothetical protein